MVEPEVEPEVNQWEASVSKWVRALTPVGERISEEYNAKRGSEPSKCIDFSIHFPSNFHVFSEHLSDPVKNRFLDAQSGRLASKVRFSSHFGSKGGPKIDPWSDIFGQKGSKNRVPRMAVTLLVPTWARPAAQNGPKPHFHRFFTDLGSIFHRFYRF